MQTDSRWLSTNLFAALAMLTLLTGPSARATAQESGGAGTVQGTVVDSTGGVMVAVTVYLSNAVSGLKREATTDAVGKFIFRNLPPNPYHLTVMAQGFQTLQQDVDVRTAVPMTLNLTLQVEGATSTVEVVGHTTDLIEMDPTAHVDIDQSLIDKLPLASSSGLNDVIMKAAPGVVADSNGFFHPLGDHAQTQFSIDNQPITDQQSRLYSNQISQDAVQSMEVITGVPPAEFGDKSSLVVRIITKSGLDQPRPSGSVDGTYGSFKSPSGDLNVGAGNARLGNFLSINGYRTDRYLDPPEFTAIHDAGNRQSLFDRVDFHPNTADAFHLNIQESGSSFDIPNTLDEAAAGQAQHQKITSVNVAPGYTRILTSDWLLTAEGYVRRDHVTYTPSPNPLSDDTGSVAQDRKLLNSGGTLNVAYAHGVQNLKIGVSASATKLNENWTLGLTDPGENSPCVDQSGSPVGDASLVTVNQCVGALSPNPGFLPALEPYDLTRGGGLYAFTGAKTITEQSGFIQDELTLHNLTVKLGLRLDRYNGFGEKTLLQPRAGLSYTLPGTGTVLRASYGRTMETPYNENLILSSTADPAIFGTSGLPLVPGTRNQVEGGIQQAFGRWVVADFGYFYKHTVNAYDFGQLFSTPIFFPVEWDHSNLYGFTGRISLLEHGGFSASTTMGSSNALFFPPGTGGLLQSQPPGEFRIDHDQKFQQTTNVQYTFMKSVGAWAALAWQYESGLVAGSAVDIATVESTLTGDQQAQIGFFCGSTFATQNAPITSCPAGTPVGATRVNIPATGTEDDVTNPPRIAPRNLFDVGMGIDNVLHSTGRTKLRFRFTITNLTNKDALFNFLSTFSGTHFVSPRAYQAQIGVTF